MRLSIIVPVYNAERFLPECIESILQQEFGEFELILVDDGSTDNSLAVCEKYKNDDARIKIVRKANGGLISAKKAGLEYATGDYVGFVDSDDWIDSDMYCKLVSAAVECGADIAVGDNVAEFVSRVVKIKQGIDYGVYDKARLIAEVYPNLAFKEQIFCLGVSPSLCTKIFKRELVTKYQFEVDECIKGGEDAACTYPCILEAEKLVYVENCWGYHYRVHNQSMTHKERILNLDERMKLLTHFYHSFSKYDYAGIERQLGLYSLAGIQALVLNYFTHNVHKDKAKMEAALTTIRANAAWDVVLKYALEEKLPKLTGCVVNYIKEPAAATSAYILRSIRINRMKAMIKNVLVKVKLYR